MALNRVFFSLCFFFFFLILTIFGNFAKDCESFFQNGSKKACSARLYDTIKTAFYQKSVITCRPAAKQPQDVCNDEKQHINADFFVSQSWLATASNFMSNWMKRKEATTGNFLPKCWGEHGVRIQHHVVNMSTIHTISHIRRP